jgi:hypothetical protein
MKRYIMKGLRVTYVYCMVLVIFAVFIYPFMGITGDYFGILLPYYCILMFILLFFFMYVDFRELARKEKKPAYNLSPYPLKGLVYGLIGIIPIEAVTAVFTYIRFEDPFVERIKHLGINAFLGPLWFIIKWFNEAVPAYFGVILLVPVMSALGYLAGYYDINVREKIFGKKPVQEKGFTKSPWNPSLNENKPARKKKKKKKKANKPR